MQKLFMAKAMCFKVAFNEEHQVVPSELLYKESIIMSILFDCCYFNLFKVLMKVSESIGYVVFVLWYVKYFTVTTQQSNPDK